jgi:hypothetical protein
MIGAAVGRTGVWHPTLPPSRIWLLPAARPRPLSFTTRDTLTGGAAMRRLTTFAALLVLPKDSLAFKETRRCAECHHAPFTVWALNEGKRRGYAVDDKALAELTARAAARTIPTRSRRHGVRSLPPQADPLSRIGSILSREVMS